MDAELHDLMSQLRSISDTVDLQRLNERNAVDVMLYLLKESFIQGVFTVDGREFITYKYLRRLIHDEVLHNGGRFSIVDLPSALDVDMVAIEAVLPDYPRFCEEECGDTILYCNGDILTTSYLQALVEECRERIRSEMLLPIRTIAHSFQLPSVFVLDLLRDHISRGEQQRDDGILLANHSPMMMEDQVLISEAYCTVRRQSLLGGLRASLFPIPLGVLRDRLGLSDTSPAVIHRLVLELIDEKGNGVEGELIGGGNDGSYVPLRYVQTRNKMIKAFFDSNGYVEYPFLRSLGIVDPRQYMIRMFGCSFTTEEATVLPSHQKKQKPTNSKKKSGKPTSSLSVCDGVPPVPPHSITIGEGTSSGLPLSECFIRDDLVVKAQWLLDELSDTNPIISLRTSLRESSSALVDCSRDGLLLSARIINGRKDSPWFRDLILPPITQRGSLCNHNESMVDGWEMDELTQQALHLTFVHRSILQEFEEKILKPEACTTLVRPPSQHEKSSDTKPCKGRGGKAKREEPTAKVAETSGTKVNAQALEDCVRKILTQTTEQSQIVNGDGKRSDSTAQITLLEHDEEEALIRYFANRLMPLVEARIQDMKQAANLSLVQKVKIAQSSIEPVWRGLWCEIQLYRIALSRCCKADAADDGMNRVPRLDGSAPGLMYRCIVQEIVTKLIRLVLIDLLWSNNPNNVELFPLEVACKGSESDLKTIEKECMSNRTLKGACERFMDVLKCSNLEDVVRQLISLSHSAECPFALRELSRKEEKVALAEVRERWCNELEKLSTCSEELLTSSFLRVLALLCLCLLPYGLLHVSKKTVRYVMEQLRSVLTAAEGSVRLKMEDLEALHGHVQKMATPSNSTFKASDDVYKLFHEIRAQSVEIARQDCRQLQKISEQ